jgi:hypothetical protein
MSCLGCRRIQLEGLPHRGTTLRHHQRYPNNPLAAPASGEKRELGLRYRSQCTVKTHDTCSDKTLHHTCDTTPGESGSPMFTSDNVIRAVRAGLGV